MKKITEEKDKRVVYNRFRNEFGSVKDDLSATDSRHNTLLSMRIRHYGPALGSHLPFFAMVIRSDAIDIITIFAWLVISFFTFFLIRDNYEWLDGEHGQIEYSKYLLNLLNTARNEGNSIDEDDHDAQYGWLEKYIIGGGLNMDKNRHPLHTRSPILYKRIRRYNRGTLIFLSIAIVNFILSTIPCFTSNMESEAKELGMFFEFLPGYLQCLYLAVF